jgi:hypothetical protein
MKKVNKLIKFTDEELYAELQRREVDKESLHHKTLTIDGFTGKDVVCIQGGAYDDSDLADEYGPSYHFYLKVDGNLFDAYYMNCCTDPHRMGDKEVEPSRWPEQKDDEYSTSAALNFVPPKFAEASENCYEYHGKTDIKKHLAKHGITDYRIWDKKLNDEEAGHDHNYDA